MYTWEFFAYISFGIRKTPTWKNSTHVFKYSRLSFLIFFFFHFCYRYHWYYVKDCFAILCFKSAEGFTFVKICQNEVLSEERQLMTWVVIIQVRIFWVLLIFREEILQREFDGWEFSGWEFPQWKEFSYNHFLQKIINKFNKTSTKRYML